jgi:hypothetical protein
MARKGGNTPADPISRDVVARIPKGADLELHVSIIEVEGVRGIDLRDYVTTTDKYGRTGILPLTDPPTDGQRLDALIEALQQIRKAL